MDVKNILAHCDHTLLKQESTWAQIKEVCDDGLKYGCASVCIPASFVKQAADYVGNELKICTVIGFPNGYTPNRRKGFETAAGGGRHPQRRRRDRHGDQHRLGEGSAVG